MKTQELLRNIYRQSFGIDPEFEDALFATCSTNIKTLEINGEIVSFLFALPCKIKWNKEEIKATYIFAAATHKEHRKKGYMGRLLEKVKSENKGAFILRPATEHLVSYYKKFGFSEIGAQDIKRENISLIPTKEFKKLSEIADPTKEGEFIAMVYNCSENINGIYFPYTMP